MDYVYLSDNSTPKLFNIKAGDEQTVSLQYSIDGGASWVTISTSTSYMAGYCCCLYFDGHYRYEHSLQAVLPGSTVPSDGRIEFRVVGGRNTRVSSISATIFNT